MNKSGFLIYIIKIQKSTKIFCNR